MSEYQYYEFRALDRPLTKEEQASLRSLSSRAEITPTQFVNVYNYGSFRGSPAALLERYFDIFVYIANWGTHQLMLRLPRRLLDPATAARYSVEGATVREAGDFVILEYLSEDEGGGWIGDDEGSEWMTTLLPLRAALAAGDLRPLYLGWLSGIQYDEGAEEIDEEERADDEDDDDQYAFEPPVPPGLRTLPEATADDGHDQYAFEPPVPPGLRTLPEAMRAMADFLRVGADLIAVAAEESADLDETGPTRHALEQWISGFTEAEKNALLLRLVADDDTTLRVELLRHFWQATTPESVPTIGRRTAGQLIRAAEHREAERKRIEEERRVREQALKQREAAAARAEYLAGLAGKEPELWQQVETLISTKRPTDYDQAVTVLKDLRDLAARNKQPDLFSERLARVRGEHAHKPSFIERLDRAKLGGSK